MGAFTILMPRLYSGPIKSEFLGHGGGQASLFLKNLLVIPMQSKVWELLA